MKHILSVWATRHRLLIIFLLFPFFSSCVSTGGETDLSTKDPFDFPKGDLSEKQKKVLQGANWALGKRKLLIGNRSFNLDCSGTVMAVYYYAGIDLSRDFAQYSGGGVSRIYQYLSEKGLVYDTNKLFPGDIIFWDNSFDANGDGKRNDPLTHMGIVTDINKDGTVYYIHEHYKKGIIEESMNLLLPDDISKNSAMRMRGSGMEGGWLSSHLFRESAMAYELEN